MERQTMIRSALVRAGLISPPLVPHEFETAMHLLARGSSTPVAQVPNIVTPTEGAHCARDGCDRDRNDPIHHLPED
jgi:hypothetical protein